MAENFKIIQTISFTDFLRVLFYELPKMKIVSRIFYFGTAIGIVSVLMDFASPVQHQVAWYILISKLVMVPVVLITFVFVFGSLIALLLMSLRPNHFKNVTFLFNHWGMTKTGTGFEFPRPWSQFTQYRETKRFFFLYITENDAHAIKKSSFESSAQLAEFKFFISAKFK